MSPRWFRRSRDRATASENDEPRSTGCAVLLERQEATERGDKTIEALVDRYSVETLDEARLQYRVMVDDARFPHEAVVRLATVLDEIDPDWPGCFSWPMSMSKPTIP
jgi:hypothetical protein